MNKELILKYKDEFEHWLNEGSIEYFEMADSQWHKSDIIWETKANPEKVKIVINDEYVEFRKALAEGIPLQRRILWGTACDFDKSWTDWCNDTLEFTHNGTPCEYRIKPDEPKFKVGDWVKYSDQELMSDYRGYYKVSTILNEDNIILEGLDWCNQSDELIKWKPQPGEWCWFWNDNDSIPTLNQFLKMDKTFTSSYAVKHVNNIRFPEIYNNCEPFVGTLPSNL